MPARRPGGRGPRPCRCRRAPARSGPPPAVLNAVLGGGYSSRLSQEIRIKRGLSYSAGSSIEPRREAGLFRGSVQTKNESAPEVVRLLQAELDRMIAAPVEADELAVAQAHPDRRLQPQRRDDRRAGRGDPRAGRRQAAAGRADDAHRGDRGGRPRPTSSAMPRPTSGRPSGASPSPARPSVFGAALKDALPALVIVRPGRARRSSAPNGLTQGLSQRSRRRVGPPKTGPRRGKANPSYKGLRLLGQ